ncbi:MAG: O-antigen ligase family protein [Elusimicrobiota bacterium]
MLAALVGVQLAAGLLLRGAWDLWAQSAVLLFLIAGAALWIAAGAVRGRLPLPSSAPARWAAALAVLSFASAFLGPVRAYALPAWAASAAGLWLLPAATMLSTGERLRVEQALRAAAWVLVLLAVHQRFHGVERPPASLLNQNVFAGAILLLLPVAARRGDLLLAAGLLLCLWWSRSVGAWLGLSVALVLHRRSVGPFAYWAGAVAGFAGLIAAYAKLQSPEVLHRLAWWSAAWRMACDAPWRGLGPGAYAYALPAYAAARPELSTLFAHQHFLETAAERGWPYLLLWLGGLAVILRRADPAKRFGPVAALAHGLVDYALSVPGVFWLFCLSVAWSLPESEEAVAVPAGRKIPALAALALVAGSAAFWVAGNWSADRLRSRVFADSASLTPEKAAALLASSEEIRPHPEAARARAEILIASSNGPNSVPVLEEAAGHLRRAVSMDPYRESNRALLEEVERRLGRPGTP